ncbi:MAG: hypothetical protein DRR19_24090 [Candidatus Parabeggiatoa sp. nov. 1]|nr:MAG: hypothetical protein DRR19_24090 [Gammaproteobacteria bacterium]
MKMLILLFSNRLLESLRYRENQTAPSEKPDSHELAFLRLRYKAPNGRYQQIVRMMAEQDIINTVDNTSSRFRFAAAVAAFGQQLRGGTYLERFCYDDILSLARDARGEYPYGYRGELVNLAKSLSD